MTQDRLIDVAPAADPAGAEVRDVRHIDTRRALRVAAPARPWQLDARTRQVGRRGVAQARAALQQARAAGRPLDAAA